LLINLKNQIMAQTKENTKGKSQQGNKSQGSGGSQHGNKPQKGNTRPSKEDDEEDE
jgi:hypothetical protein